MKIIISTVLLLNSLLLVSCVGGEKISARTNCTPEERKCEGQNVLKCSSDGQEWEIYKTCKDGLCSQGECINVPLGGDNDIEFDGDGSDEDRVDGDLADGDLADGDLMDGDMTDGDIVDGDNIDRDSLDGDTVDGDTIDSDVSDGDVTDSNITDGDASDRDMSDGDVIDGDDEIVIDDHFNWDIPGVIRIQPGLWGSAYITAKNESDEYLTIQFFDGGTIEEWLSYHFINNEFILSVDVPADAGFIRETIEIRACDSEYCEYKKIALEVIAWPQSEEGTCHNPIPLLNNELRFYANSNDMPDYDTPVGCSIHLSDDLADTTIFSVNSNRQIEVSVPRSSGSYIYEPVDCNENPQHCVYTTVPNKVPSIVLEPKQDQNPRLLAFHHLVYDGSYNMGYTIRTKPVQYSKGDQCYYFSDTILRSGMQIQDSLSGLTHSFEITADQKTCSNQLEEVANFQGPDRHYKIVLDPYEIVIAKVQPLDGFDPVLFFAQGCDDNIPSSQCFDLSNVKSSGQSEELLIRNNNSKSKEYYLAVGAIESDLTALDYLLSLESTGCAIFSSAFSTERVEIPDMDNYGVSLIANGDFIGVDTSPTLYLDIVHPNKAQLGMILEDNVTSDYQTIYFQQEEGPIETLRLVLDFSYSERAISSFFVLSVFDWEAGGVGTLGRLVIVKNEEDCEFLPCRSDYNCMPSQKCTQDYLCVTMEK
jgi:hypothetical protein